jgi:hypothetical protein
LLIPDDGRILTVMALVREKERTMAELFTVGEEATHIVDDPQCPECLEEYPERCRCGGLIHAASGEADPEGGEWPLTRCDRCGRSEEEIE